jgi:hypothetical protein
MARTWTSQPPGLVAVRLNVTPETRLRLNELAGRAGVPMAQLARRLVESVCAGKTVAADSLVAEMRQEKMAQFSDSSDKVKGKPARRPRGKGKEK